MSLFLENINPSHFIGKNCHILRKNSDQITFRTSSENNQGICINNIMPSNGQYKIFIKINSFGQYFYWNGTYNGCEKIKLKNEINEFTIGINQDTPFDISIMVNDILISKKIITLSIKIIKDDNTTLAKSENKIIKNMTTKTLKWADPIQITINDYKSFKKWNDHPELPLVLYDNNKIEKEEIEITDIIPVTENDTKDIGNTNSAKENTSKNMIDKMLDELFNNSIKKSDIIFSGKNSQDPNILVDFSPDLFETNSSISPLEIQTIVPIILQTGAKI